MPVSSRAGQGAGACRRQAPPRPTACAPQKRVRCRLRSQQQAVVLSRKAALVGIDLRVVSGCRQQLPGCERHGKLATPGADARQGNRGCMQLQRRPTLTGWPSASSGIVPLANSAASASSRHAGAAARCCAGALRKLSRARHPRLLSPKLGINNQHMPATAQASTPARIECMIWSLDSVYVRFKVHKRYCVANRLFRHSSEGAVTHICTQRLHTPRAFSLLVLR